ncbi:ANL family adenylate-forming protein [Selenomonas massiliensis]|uniref:ANL family adenylate-forming protein n=1 Tax=Selenomonas massiliensis TaxID=2058293 RepID=UPI0018FE473F|nr:fatty acid--CoA ligase family protein [Selenomonas massiliensis]
MHIDFFLERFCANSENEAMIWHDKVYTYHDILSYIEQDREKLKESISSPMVVSIEADFSPHAAALLLTLIDLGCVIVPLTESVASKKGEFKDIAQVEATVILHEDDSFSFQTENRRADHEIIQKLKRENHPGLILFSSGSTGKSKAAVHDFLPLLEKFKVPRKCMRMMTFLLFDHIGGINTLLYVLSNTGCIITLDSRQPEAVCRNIEKYHAEVLPTSPSFINLLLLSEAYKSYNVSSLKMVTYGTEAMPESTLKRFHDIFPNVKLLQTYGLSEIGIMRSKSLSSDSLWVKIGGEDFQTRVVDGLLEVRAKSAMLGYLNAPSPFTEDGWFRTGDEVLVDGEYFRILGRRSEMINVGGQKVFPAEVESVIQEMDGVEDVAVSGEVNPMLGNIVKARVKIAGNESLADFKKRLRLFCKNRLESYKIPQKVELIDHMMTGSRFKKMRREV